MSDQIPSKIVDEAIAWTIRLEMSEPNSEDTAEFEQWLQGDKQHQLAWSRVRQMRTRYAGLPSQTIGQTLQQVETDRAVSRRRILKGLTLLSVMLGSGWLAKQYTPWQRLIADQSTVTGEQKRLTLADGSQLVLNTDSAVSTDFNSSLRRVLLHRGEIALTTGDDSGYSPRRPLLIETAFGQIQALDTGCVLRLLRDRLRVFVQQGKLQLSNTVGARETLVAGDDVWLSTEGISQADSAIAADAWLRGAIAGHDIPLGELLDELARYRVGIIDYSSELANLPVSGVFQLKNTDQTLQFLANTHPIQVDFRTPFWVVVRSA